MGKTLVLGKTGEDEAVEYLQKQNYKIVQRNFKTKIGEVDIIALDKNVWVFVEVKLRSSNYWGTPLESIGRKKLNLLVKTAQYYMMINKIERQEMRLDAIEVYLLNNEFTINHIKNITL